LPSTIEQVNRELKDRGLTVLAINLGEPRDVLAAWVKSRNVTSTVLLDPTGDVARSYAIAHTPTVFLVDRQGRLVGKAIGTRQWTGDKGRALLRLVMER
jgi:peroxiredoxin